jgi:hypothetical protein
MFDEWRHIRTFKKRVASLKERESELRAHSGIDTLEPEQLKVAFRLMSASMALDDLETARLVRKARRLGIEIPQNEKWWREDQAFEGKMISDGVYEGRFYLTEWGKAGVSRLIWEEKKKNVEWWVKVITPILALIVAILALLHK